MTATNDITGDKLVSKIPTDEYRENFDRVFGQKPKEEEWEQLELPLEE